MLGVRIDVVEAQILTHTLITFLMYNLSYINVAQMSFICHIHNYTEYNEEWNVFSAFNPSKWSSVHLQCKYIVLYFTHRLSSVAVCPMAVETI